MNIYSPVSKLQEASLHAMDTYNCQWIVDWVDPNERFEMQGTPVKAGEPILLRHAQTGHYFSSDKVVEKNDFGSEYEVMCHSFAQQNKTQNLHLEKNGQLTTDVPTRYQGEQNLWVFETAPDPSHSQPIDQLQKFNIEELFADVKKFVEVRASVDAVRACLQEIDTGKTGQIDADDFRWGLIDLGYNLNTAEANEVVKHFDTTGTGQFQYEDFLAKL